jgi:ABC-2 type transport system permease protein
MTQAAFDAKGPGTLRQLAALARLELLALRRNLTATALVVVAPLGLGFLRLGGYDAATVGASAAVTRMAGTIAVIVILFVHHHLVTVYATRRQELVLKRLRAGLPSDWTILAGAASGTVAIFLGQALLLAGYGVLALGLPVPANPLTVGLATLLVAALMAAVSAALSAVTRSSEAAMLTTLPTMALFLATPGIAVPFGALPRGLEAAAWFGPMGPFPEVVRAGWLGQDPNGAELSLLAGLVEVLPGLAVLAGWLLLGLLAVRLVFRWQPRHR